MRATEVAEIRRRRAFTMNDTISTRIVLIDDEQPLLEELRARLSTAMASDDVEIVVWAPSHADSDPDTKLSELAVPGTALVITDYNLTKHGMRGLEGSAVQSWCLRKLIPVGEFSRGHSSELPGESTLFSMRVPDSTADAVNFIVAVYRGFRLIRSKLRAGTWTSHTISTITADILGRIDYEPALSLYFSRLSSSNEAIRDHLIESRNPGAQSNRDMVDILSYVIGHVLLNLILAYPGPILSRTLLSAYLAISESEADELVGRAQIPKYEGPFSEIEHFVWRHDVDSALEHALEEGGQLGPFDVERYNRHAAQTILARTPSIHECSRNGCAGELGGYWCPFTKRTVCYREDCSRAAPAWIPEGADLCRVEAEFFEEFLPLLGL